MTSVDEIQVRLADYVLGDLSLADFEDWFVSSSWNVHQNATPEALKLVFEIEAKLSEYSSGHIQEPSLRRALANLAKSHLVSVTIGGSQSTLHVNTVSSQSALIADELRIGFVDIRPSLAYV